MRPTTSSNCCRSPSASAISTAASSSTTAAPSKSGAARRSPARPTSSSPASAKFFAADGDVAAAIASSSEVLQTGEPVRNEEVVVERPDGVAHRRADQHRSAARRAAARWSASSTASRTSPSASACSRRCEQSQQDLRQQEQRWNATYEHAAIGIVEIDAEGRFLRVNESICDITGLTPRGTARLAAVRAHPSGRPRRRRGAVPPAGEGRDRLLFDREALRPPATAA